MYGLSRNRSKQPRKYPLTSRNSTVCCTQNGCTLNYFTQNYVHCQTSEIMEEPILCFIIPQIFKNETSSINNLFGLESTVEKCNELTQQHLMTMKTWRTSGLRRTHHVVEGYHSVCWLLYD